MAKTRSVNEYPKVMYRMVVGEDGRREVLSRRFADAAAAKRAGDGWAESPEEVGARSAVPNQSTPVGVDEPDMDTASLCFGSFNESQALRAASKLTTVEQVENAVAGERARPAGARDQVLAELTASRGRVGGSGG